MKRKNERMILSAVFLSMGMVLPFFTMQIKEIGDSLLPMHLPVMLCGIMCGSGYGAIVGFVLPLLRSVCFNMPPLYPNAIWMAFELATYGGVAGFLYNRIQKPSVKYLYFCLIAAMISGRVVWGIAKAILLGVGQRGFTIEAFIIGGFADAIPGILLQLIVIPFIIRVTNYVKK